MNLAEGVQVVSFGILAVMMIGAAIGVVLSSSIVYSAFLLGGVFISIAGLYLLLNGDFVAAAQVLIYVGAVNVLILFAIMLVNKRQNFAPYPSAGLRKIFTGVVSLGLFALLSTMILATPWAYATAPVTIESSIVLIGEHFFSDFLLPFELASVLLLMAMVGAIILARREYLPDATTSSEMPQTVLTLPERPREMAAIGNIGNESGENPVYRGGSRRE
ncbi:NADH-quinone oxidoreductase subunit J [Tolypothrix sp. FACHB-123]|uniref:NADH-quinone oxidoreductase subunit J n=1 Tax=Tolypothrix sp. FACHB-123 TaxID=2692868 RepID=UPI0016830247|nr:NADH-quinone oxidoreductase subunit J [Tolypothrix sp. FACHB-123]MBD2354871.1 NADH-quinone oxidoreductase subunit J [Tolypothrix sp. FACHB-123]